MEALPELAFAQFIQADGDRLITDSLKVAAVHGKRHDRVIRLIRQRMTESGEWGLLNFGESSYSNSQGKEQPMFTMTQAGYRWR